MDEEQETEILSLPQSPPSPPPPPRGGGVGVRDWTRPVCREFVRKRKCRMGGRCKYYHPMSSRLREGRRRHTCYCGAELRLVVTADIRDPNEPSFFYLCKKTKKRPIYCSEGEGQAEVEDNE